MALGEEDFSELEWQQSHPWTLVEEHAGRFVHIRKAGRKVKFRAEGGIQITNRDSQLETFMLRW